MAYNYGYAGVFGPYTVRQAGNVRHFGAHIDNNVYDEIAGPQPPKGGFCLVNWKKVPPVLEVCNEDGNVVETFPITGEKEIYTL